MNDIIKRTEGYNAMFSTLCHKGKVMVDGTFSILQRFN